MLPAWAFRELDPSRPGEKSAPGNSIAMISLDAHRRFVIRRVGRSEDSKILISSCVTGTIQLSVRWS